MRTNSLKLFMATRAAVKTAHEMALLPRAIVVLLPNIGCFLGAPLAQAQREGYPSAAASTDERPAARAALLGHKFPLEARSGAKHAAILPQALIETVCSGQDEAEERRRRSRRARFVLRVVLTSEEVGVIADFTNLHAVTPVVLPCEEHTLGLQRGHAGGVDFVTVAVPLVDHRLATIEPPPQRLGAVDHCRSGAKPHGAAHHCDGRLGHENNDGLRRRLVKLCAVGATPTEDLAREFDHCRLKAHADAQVWLAAGAAKTCGQDFALDAPVAESPRHKHAIDGLEA
mmetsp:Transcript_72610/g.201359  ORF Transcript_72610/g.201359 Transcript_72610/m.201359 type:complete len:286 (+) Transcript_72610:71-928(+)